MKEIYIEDGRYKVVGLFGCWVESYENNIKFGDIRLIGNKLMSAYSVRKSKLFFKKDRVAWCAVELGNTKFSMEDIRNWVNSL